MAGSLNRVSIIGNLGADPEVKSFQNGGKVCNIRVACTESWKDKNGEKQERTEWVSVAIFQEGLVGVAERYLKKGSKVFVEGKLQTRKWQDQSGNDRYSTEVVLQSFGGQLILLGDGGSRDGGQRQGNAGGAASGGRTSGGGGDGWSGQNQQSKSFADELDDDVPFLTRNSVW